MKLTLSSGKVINLGVSHFWGNQGRRGTIVWMRRDDGLFCEAIAMCAAEDNFCKRTGRRLAAGRLISQMSDFHFSKMDRRSVFQAICPEQRSKRNLLADERAKVQALLAACHAARNFGSQGDTHEGFSVSNIIDIAIQMASPSPKESR